MVMEVFWSSLCHNRKDKLPQNTLAARPSLALREYIIEEQGFTWSQQHGLKNSQYCSHVRDTFTIVIVITDHFLVVFKRALFNTSQTRCEQASTVSSSRDPMHQ